MGSLTSTPTIVTTTSSTPSSSSDSASPTETSEEKTNTQEDESQSRKASLLESDRSRSGTVNTSLQGVLSSVDDEDTRKTLLGE